MSSSTQIKTLERESNSPQAEREPLPEPAPSSSQPMFAIQRGAGNRALGTWLQARARPGSGAPLALQAKPDEGQPAPEPEPKAPAQPLLVDDDAEHVTPGQMRKTEFLDQLKASVCSAADDALRGTIWSTMGCPYVERWVGHYQQQSSQHVERALHKYAPETAQARTAKEYIPLVTQRVRRGVEQWAKTGEVTGVPPELAQGGMPGATFQGLAGAALSGIGSAIGGAASAIGGAIGGAAKSIGKALFKERAGGATDDADPQVIQSQLKTGQPLEPSTRARMESAFGADFSSVRIHSDANAAQLSGGLNARAFTIGSDIAFGTGEYQPGHVIGEALIAHELAHVVQQREGSTLAQTKRTADYGALEEDADVSAVGAMATTWEGAMGALKDIGRNAMPRLRSGLRLQGCASSRPKLVTNLGAGVQSTLSGVINDPTAPDLTEAEATTQLARMGLLSKVKPIRPPSNRYDCHGYTFAGGEQFIPDPEVEKILHDNGYAVTATPSVGDIVIYRNATGISHSGVIIEVQGTTVTKIRSKWGRLGLYEHAPNDVPPGYGAWQAYHTSRSGGHRLHQKP